MAQLPSPTFGYYCEPQNKANPVYGKAVHFLINSEIKQRWFNGCGTVNIDDINHISCNNNVGGASSYDRFIVSINYLLLYKKNIRSTLTTN